MSLFWQGVLVGGFLGCAAGVLAMAICVAASQADRRIERMRDAEVEHGDIHLAGDISGDPRMVYDQTLAQMRKKFDAEHGVTNGGSW